MDRRDKQRSPQQDAKPRASSLDRNHKFRVVPRVRFRLESPPPLPAPQQGSPSPRLRLAPATPWLHADGQLADEGVCYSARYIGCVQVKESMKALTYTSSSRIANECIARVCEAAGLKSADRMPRLEKMARSLGDVPIMEQAGSIVNLTITSSRLTLTTLEEGQVLASHEIPNISFVWWGPEMMEYVGYVAEDSRYGRVCSVLECGGVAQKVVLTIGQAFEVGFKEHLKPSYAKSSIELPAPAPPASDDPEYYNQLPGKVPPNAPTEPGPPSRPAPAAPAAPGAALYANDPRGPFDMQPFGACLPAGGTGGGATAAAPPPVPPRRTPSTSRSWIRSYGITAPSAGGEPRPCCYGTGTSWCENRTARPEGLC